MNKRIAKFLEFKGKTLLFLAKDGTYWIAVKPICEAIEVNYDRQLKTLKEDPILGPAYAVQPMQVPGDQVRNLGCLPEYLIYGWIFSIRSESKELLEYKSECYKVLFDFFHGTITSRRDILRQKIKLQAERMKLEEVLSQNPDFVRLGNVKAGEARLGIALKGIENQEIREQMEIEFSES